MVVPEVELAVSPVLVGGFSFSLIQRGPLGQNFVSELFEHNGYSGGFRRVLGGSRHQNEHRY